jgi:hypothetical protein
MMRDEVTRQMMNHTMSIAVKKSLTFMHWGNSFVQGLEKVKSEENSPLEFCGSLWRSVTWKIVVYCGDRTGNCRFCVFVSILE